MTSISTPSTTSGRSSMKIARTANRKRARPMKSSTPASKCITSNCAHSTPYPPSRSCAEKSKRCAMPNSSARAAPSPAAKRPNRFSRSSPAISPTNCCTARAVSCAAPALSAATRLSPGRANYLNSTRNSISAISAKAPPKSRLTSGVLSQGAHFIFSDSIFPVPLFKTNHLKQIHLKTGSMKPSLQKKLEQLLDRHEELAALLSDADTISNQEKFRALSKEFAEIEPVVLCFRQYRQVLDDCETARAMLGEADPELRSMAEEELAGSRARLEPLEAELQTLLLPRDPNDSHNIFLEVRAGTGGDEAAIFAGDLFRMYSRYAERQGWKVEILSENPGEHGGYKEIISRVEGSGVYGQLKF